MRKSSVILNFTYKLQKNEKKLKKFAKIFEIFIKVCYNIS